MQQSGCDLASNCKDKEQYSKSPFNQSKVEDEERSSHILEQDQSVVESQKRTPWKSYKEPIRFDYQDSYQRSSWVLDPTFQVGIQQNSYRTLRKPSIGTSYTSNIERGSSPIPGFYRGKSTNVRGTIPFSATQQWAKKAQTSVFFYQVKDGQEDEISQEHETCESSVKDSTIEHEVVACKMDANIIGSTNIVEKELELKTFEKKEFSSPAIPLVEKVVASIRGPSNMPSAPFNLNVNSEDWPPLSNSRTTYYPKNTRKFPLTSYQCELSSRLMNKLSIDRRSGYHIGLESKVEGSILSVISSRKDSINYTTSGSITVGRQKGIMIGSLSVPLGDYMHLSRPGLGSASRRISTPIWTNQSYTSVLAAPPIRYNRDPMTSIGGRQKAHEGITCSKFEESSNVQIIDSYGGPCHNRTSSLRSTSSINFNSKHMRGLTFERTNTYRLGDRGDRGILPKQPLWSSGPIRHLPQKVWRPVRSTIENADSNGYGRIGIDGSQIINNEKEHVEFPSNEESVNATSSQSEGMQIWDKDISKGVQCPTSAMDMKVQFGEGNGILDLKNLNENSPQSITHLKKSIFSNTQHLQCQKETSQIAFPTIKDYNENDCQPIKCNTMEQNTKCIFQKKNDNIEYMDEKAHIETAPSHPTWIAEAIQFHLSSKSMFQVSSPQQLFLCSLIFLIVDFFNYNKMTLMCIYSYQGIFRFF